MTSNIAIVPARKGSKRLPNKNMRLLKNKPLICWTIEEAIKSNCFSEIIVSTDDLEIIEIAKNYKEVNIDLRPKHLATDEATVIQVLLDLVDRTLKNQYDICTILPPTSPLRNYEHIIECIKLLDNNIDSVVSMKEYNFSPECAFLSLENNIISEAFPSNPLLNGVTRKQEQAKYYHPNGAIYVSWVKSIIANKSFFNGDIKGYLMSEECSVDIDTLLDFELVEMLVDDNIN